MTRARTGYSSGWPAHAAFWCALLFALVSLYWALGGELALETIGGSIEQSVRHPTTLTTLVLFAVTVVKAAGAVFALALVRPWGRVFPRRLLLVTGWLGTVILVGYGGVLTGLQMVLALLGVEGTDTLAYRGHMFFWDPWFLVWGVLLGLAVLRVQRARSR